MNVVRLVVFVYLYSCVSGAQAVIWLATGKMNGLELPAVANHHFQVRWNGPVSLLNNEYQASLSG